MLQVTFERASEIESDCYETHFVEMLLWNDAFKGTDVSQFLLLSSRKVGHSGVELKPNAVKFYSVTLFSLTSDCSLFVLWAFSDKQSLDYFFNLNLSKLSKACLVFTYITLSHSHQINQSKQILISL